MTLFPIPRITREGTEAAGEWSALSERLQNPDASGAEIQVAIREGVAALPKIVQTESFLGSGFWGVLLETTRNQAPDLLEIVVEAGFTALPVMAEQYSPGAQKIVGNILWHYGLSADAAPLAGRDVLLGPPEITAQGPQVDIVAFHPIRRNTFVITPRFVGTFDEYARVVRRSPITEEKAYGKALVRLVREWHRTASTLPPLAQVTRERAGEARVEAARLRPGFPMAATRPTALGNALSWPFAGGVPCPTMGDGTRA